MFIKWQKKQLYASLSGEYLKTVFSYYATKCTLSIMCFSVTRKHNNGHESITPCPIAMVHYVFHCRAGELDHSCVVENVVKSLDGWTFLDFFFFSFFFLTVLITGQ